MFILIPVIICFDLKESRFIKNFLKLLILFYGLDAILTLNTGYYDFGNIVMKRSTILKHSIKTNFLENFFTILSIVIVY